jgi:pantoate--beta-alanine ligase
MFVGYTSYHMIIVHTTHQDLSNHLAGIRKRGQSIGFVPTMGALHAGHLSLMEQAMNLTDHVVVSIFVNPTQFNNAVDLEKYPKDLSNDARMIANRLGTDNIVIYAPSVEDVYGCQVAAKEYTYDGLEHIMEGANRPGHFNGVGTVLEFLFRTIKPKVAIFGEKDFQQLQIVRKLVKKLKLPTTIIGAAIHREQNMLAMSSRNERLTAQAREKAGFIYKSLELAKSYFKAHSAPQTEGFIAKRYAAQEHIDLEYFTIANELTLEPITRKSKGSEYRAFIVAHIEGVRLIDNMKLD